MINWSTKINPINGKLAAKLEYFVRINKTDKSVYNSVLKNKLYTIITLVSIDLI